MSMPVQSSSANASTLIGIDILRGTLAIMVLAGHAVESSAWLHHAESSEEMQTIPAIILGSPGHWVCGFFILSGFCIHRSIMGMREKGGPFALPYTLARLTRLYPIYLIAILLTAVSWLVLGAFDQQDELTWQFKFLAHLFMLQGTTGTIHELRPSWSITYEAVYYLIWPVFLMMCGWRRMLALMVSCGSMLFIATVAVVTWKVTANGEATSRLIPLWLIPSQFVLWAGGAFLAEKWDVVVPRVKRWWIPLSLLGIAGGSVSCAFLEYYKARQWILISASYAAIPFWLGLIASFTIWQGAPKLTSVARIMGLLSYPLYILHEIILDALVRFLPGYGLWTDTFILASLAGALVLLFGIPLEITTMDWRKSVLERVKKKPLAEPVLQKPA